MYRPEDLRQATDHALGGLKADAALKHRILMNASKKLRLLRVRLYAVRLLFFVWLFCLWFSLCFF